MEVPEPAGLRPQARPSSLLKKHRAIVLDLLAEQSEQRLDARIEGTNVARKVLFELERQARVDEEVLEVALGQPVANPRERAELRELVLRHCTAPQEEQGHTLTEVADLLDEVTHRVERLEAGIDGYANQVGEAMVRRREELRLATTDRVVAIDYRAPRAFAHC